MVKLLCRYYASTSNKKITDNFCIYASRDFANIPQEAARRNKAGNATIKALGTNLPRILDWNIELNGEWKKAKKFGWEFIVSSYVLIPPDSTVGIIAYLSNPKNYPGIGKVTATNIVKTFGNKTLEVIEKTPNKLLTVKGINIDKIGTITECFKKNIGFSKLCSYLAEFGISQGMSEKVYAKYNNDSIEKIKSNPYSIQDIRGVGFKTCEKIARKENCALDSFQRIEGAINEVLKNYCETTQNVCMKYNDFEKSTYNLLNNGYSFETVTVKGIREVLTNLHNRQKIFCKGGKYVFSEEYERAEDNISSVINIMLRKKLGIPAKLVEMQIAKFLERESSLKLSNKQKSAVVNALMNPISVITGSPGTGKTTILKCIIACYNEINREKKITLLAPTGKAARRMSEATGVDASTIHSKLGIYDEYGATLSIEDGLIVVDESSMIDTLLMEKLIKAITPTSQIVFVGDIDQLPSVGPGSVLSDLIRCNKIPTATLTEIFRQEGGTIVENAIKINKGDNSLCYDNSFDFIEANNEQDAAKIIRQIYADNVKLYGIDNVALLTPLRRTQNGRFVCVSDQLNLELRDVTNNATGSALTVVYNDVEYRVGDRVLQWKNTEKSSNGDVGVITNISQQNEGIMVDIHWENGNDTSEDREAMNNITLAYAMSIHKSQGSEYSCVIIPMLSEQNCPLFKRNLLYTAVTRAKKKVIVVGDKKAIDNCIYHSETNTRMTMLAQRIAQKATV